MKRTTLLLMLLAACDKEPRTGDAFGSAQQPGCYGGSECRAEALRYQTCLYTACDAQYRGCYGPDYASQVYQGAPCSSYQACIDACGCNTTCQTACGDAPSGCIACLSGALNQCLLLVECPLPECRTDAGVHAGACSSLAACCSGLSDERNRSQCMTLYNNLSPSGDDICAGVLSSFCP
jgi:hypothetical protein